MALREAQQAIAGWIRAPEGVAAALEEEDAGSGGPAPGATTRRLAALSRSDDALDAASPEHRGHADEIHKLGPQHI